MDYFNSFKHKVVGKVKGAKQTKWSVSKKLAERKMSQIPWQMWDNQFKYRRKRGGDYFKHIKNLTYKAPKCIDKKATLSFLLPKLQALGLYHNNGQCVWRLHLCHLTQPGNQHTPITESLRTCITVKVNVFVGGYVARALWSNVFIPVSTVVFNDKHFPRLYVQV